MIVPRIGMVLVKLTMFPAQIAVIGGVLAWRPIAFAMSSFMLLSYTVMIAIMVTVIALMLVAVVVIVIAVSKCGKHWQG
jgi:hypothetical protein